MKNEELTYRVIGCAMRVHKVLGCGFQEVIYQRALYLEMKKHGVEFVREKEMSIFYNGVDIGTRRVDFFVGGAIMVELKAVAGLEPVHLTQALNYCEAYNIPVGLLINFGTPRLEFKKVYNTKHPDNKDYKKN